MSEVVPFRIEIPETALDDLRQRLARTRWPGAETVEDWSQGIPLAYVQELCGYWADAYDWRRAEAALNAVPQFRTEIDGLGIHFLHARSPHEDALPLLLTHGWPGSVLEFLKVIDPLTNPTAHGGEAADAFHVICPSLPGYGFSDPPAQPGWSVEHTAGAWAQLMARLGYGSYAAQGGDWGSAVTLALAATAPGHLVGIHLNMLMMDPRELSAAGEPTPEERAALDALGRHRRTGDAYARQQATRPQTLGYGLADSPAAQCAWIVEKFWAWTDCDGHPENALTRDEMLDTVMLYWLTNAGASSARLYWESYRRPDSTAITVPAGFTRFPHEIFPISRRWAELRLHDLRYWNEVDRGGHFAAFEQPERFVSELRDCFGPLRS
jgi:pimeloyl-ACP methyl ester carboxylesterase